MADRNRFDLHSLLGLRCLQRLAAGECQPGMYGSSVPAILRRWHSVKAG